MKYTLPALAVVFRCALAAVSTPIHCLLSTTGASLDHMVTRASSFRAASPRTTTRRSTSGRLSQAVLFTRYGSSRTRGSSQPVRQPAEITALLSGGRVSSLTGGHREHPASEVRSLGAGVERAHPSPVGRRRGLRPWAMGALPWWPGRRACRGPGSPAACSSCGRTPRWSQAACGGRAAVASGASTPT